MIFNLRVFKKMIKQAYKGVGLTIGKDDTEYFLEGGSWVMRIKEKALAKEFKGALIEIVGDLPEQGETFKVRHNISTDNEIPFKELWLMKGLNFAKNEVELTDVYMAHRGTLCRVIQTGDRNIMITNEYAHLVDTSAMDDELDSYPEGPLMVDGSNSLIYWWNSTCKFVAVAHEESPKEIAILESLEKINLAEVE